MLSITAFVFLSLLEKVVIIDVILSWVRPFGEKFRANYILPIVEPFYTFVRKIIPMRVGMIDFSPLILILLIALASGAILKYNPEVASLVSF